MDHYYKDARFGLSDHFNAMGLFRWIVRRSPRSSRFVELGSYAGRSAAYMGVEIVNAGKDQRLVTIDHFPDPAIEAACRENLAPLDGVVSVIKSNSAAAADRFEDRSLAFVYVDAGHSYEDVRRDIIAWRPKIHAGGVLAGDDYWWRLDDSGAPPLGGSPFPVWRAVADTIGPNYEVMVRGHWAIWWKQI